jgi:membrane-associated phospholipid phosphatase
LTPTWQLITVLGGVGLTAPLAIAITLWLAAAHCRRLALLWCVLFGAMILLVMASKLAFLGWGIGIETLGLTGLSGHAARAAAIYPVAAFLLLFGRGAGWQNAGVALGMLAALAVAVSRVRLGAHPPSEAAAGCALGLGAALLFVARARAARAFRPIPRIVGLSMVILLFQPLLEPVRSEQWMTALALRLSGNDRPYLRATWQLAPRAYVPPCASERVRWGTLCT